MWLQDAPCHTVLGLFNWEVWMDPLCTQNSAQISISCLGLCTRTAVCSFFSRRYSSPSTLQGNAHCHVLGLESPQITSKSR